MGLVFFNKKHSNFLSTKYFLKCFLYKDFQKLIAKLFHISRMSNSDGSVNSNAWKIHSRKQISAFHGLMFHYKFYVLNSCSLPIQMISLVLRENKAEIHKFFTRNYDKWGKLSFMDFTFYANGDN